MRALRWLLALLMLTALGTAANGAEVSIPPSPARWATDTTGFLKPQTVVVLDARLRAYQNSTGHQILVYVAPTTGATPTEDWTVRTFARWKVGRKGLDDGLVLFVFPTDRKVRIEVGYGLEQTVPDAIAARIIRDTITPKLRAGQPDDAVTAGVEEILGTIGGEARGKSNEVPAPVDPYDTSRPNPMREFFGESIGVLIGLFITVAIIVLIMKLPSSKGPYIRSRGGGFGWGGFLLGAALGGFSGGGFSGGGGLSGGGGATGSW